MNTASLVRSLRSFCSTRLPLSSTRSTPITSTSLCSNLSTSKSILSASSSCSRSFHSSSSLHGFEEFFHGAHDLRTGRYWRCSDLRNKSFEDLHKLWFVLLKERNMLNTYAHFSRLQQGRFTHPERKWKVKRSMANIKVVLGERYRQFREATEPPNSPWRQMIEKHRAKKKAEKLKEKKKKTIPPKHQRVNMFSPLRKKWAFRKLKPRTTSVTTTTTESSQVAQKQ